jgi:hypothetical protein
MAMFLGFGSLGVGSLLVRPWVVRDADVFWHLATGREMWRHGELLKTDPFSYLHAGQPWVNHEWLFQWLAWPWYQATGAPGLFLVTGVLLLLAVAATGAVAWKTGCSPSSVLGSSAVATTATVAFSQPRPTALSLVLLATVVAITPRVQSHFAQQGPMRLPLSWPAAALGVVFVFWANYHATFPLGLLACGCLLLGGWLQAGFSPATIRAGGVVLGGALALTLLNPFGWKVHFVPLKVAGSALFRSHNAEWQRPDLSPEFWPLAVMTALALLGALRGWRSHPGWVLLGLSFGVLAFQSRRLIPWFGVAAVPLMALGLELSGAWLSSRFRTRNIGEKVAPILVVLGLLYGWWVGHQLPGSITQNLGKGLRADHGAFPVAMAQRLRQLAPRGNVFNDYNHGGYLHLAVGPEWKVGMDGRNDLYGESAVRHYTALALGTIPALKEFDRFQVDAALLSWEMALADGGISMQLARDKQWACAGFDDSAILMVRRRSVDPDALAKVELRQFIPTIDWDLNLTRARTNRQLPAMRTELEALAATVPSWRGLQAAALAASALRDQAGADTHRRRLRELFPIQP